MSLLNFQFELNNNVLEATMDGRDLSMTTVDGILTPVGNLYRFGIDEAGNISTIARKADKPTSPLGRLWIGLCTIYEYENVRDPETFQTKQQLVPVIVNEPCRLSQSRVAHNQGDVTMVSDTVPYVNNVIALFLRPDLIVKNGSVIDVTQHGRTTRYKGSSEPAVYTNHQEIVLEKYEDKAK